MRNTISIAVARVCFLGFGAIATVASNRGFCFQKRIDSPLTSIRNGLKPTRASDHRMGGPEPWRSYDKEDHLVHGVVACGMRFEPEGASAIDGELSLYLPVLLLGWYVRRALSQVRLEGLAQPTTQTLSNFLPG
jgi:hypothetical protein